MGCCCCCCRCTGGGIGCRTCGCCCCGLEIDAAEAITAAIDALLLLGSAFGREAFAAAVELAAALELPFALLDGEGTPFPVWGDEDMAAILIPVLLVFSLFTSSEAAALVVVVVVADAFFFADFPPFLDFDFDEEEVSDDVVVETDLSSFVVPNDAPATPLLEAIRFGAEAVAGWTDPLPAVFTSLSVLGVTFGES